MAAFKQIDQVRLNLNLSLSLILYSLLACDFLCDHFCPLLCFNNSRELEKVQGIPWHTRDCFKLDCAASEIEQCRRTDSEKLS